MSTRTVLAISLVSALSACAADEAGPDPQGALEMTTADATTLSGWFVHAGSVIGFHSESIDQQRATLHLDINGAAIDVVLDTSTFTEDGHATALFGDDLAALLALRDALGTHYPDEVTSTLQGKLLSGHADRLAEAPVGYTIETRAIDLASMRAVRGAERTKKQNADADGCGGDGATCLWGTSGWEYAVYDQGDDGYCTWQWTSYGGDNCSGRCGAGCNWFDNDYTWDCFDHDRCVDAYGGSSMSGNSNCGDEFWDASDDYALTYGPWC